MIEMRWKKHSRDSEHGTVVKNVAGSWMVLQYRENFEHLKDDDGNFVIAEEWKDVPWTDD